MWGTPWVYVPVTSYEYEYSTVLVQKNELIPAPVGAVELESLSALSQYRQISFTGSPQLTPELTLSLPH